jgi:hypothetical protein
MATGMNKRKVFSVKEKFKVIQELEKWGEKRKAVLHREFVLINSTVQTICKNRTRFISTFESNGLRVKQF